MRHRRTRAPRPRHREQVRRRHGEPRRHDQVARDLGARPRPRLPHGHAGDPSPAVRRQDGLSAAHVDAVGPAGPSGRRSTTVTAAPASLRPGRAIPRLARRQHDRPPAREDAVRLDQALHRRREDDPRQVVVREHRRLLHGSGREHDVPRADAVQGVATHGRHERPVEHAERRRRGQDSHPGIDRGHERFRLGVRLGALLEQERVGSRRGRLGGCGEPGRAAADQRASQWRFTTSRGRGPRPWHRAQAGLRPDERLDQVPGPAGPLEHLVIEPRRHHERERVEPAVDVPAGGGPGVLAFDQHAVAHGFDAGADVGYPVDLHQTVRTRSRHAQQAPRPVILERARCDRDAGRGERGPDGVALEGGDLPTLEDDRHGPVATDPFLRCLLEPLGPRGRLLALRRPNGPADLVRRGVSFRQEPPAAPVAMQPPLGLPPVDVPAEVQVAGQLPVVGVRTRAARGSSPRRRTRRLARAAVGTVDEERHSDPGRDRRTGGAHPVGDRLGRQHEVRADERDAGDHRRLQRHRRRSSGSRSWTSFLPHARANIWHSRASAQFRKFSTRSAATSTGSRWIRRSSGVVMPTGQLAGVAVRQWPGSTPSAS